MSLEIKINGTRVNIPSGQTIAYNLVNFEITDIGNRKLSYTNSFQIPKADNEDIFEFSSSFNKRGGLPYEAMSIDIIADGIIIVQDGSAFIKSYSDGFYYIQVTGNKDTIDLMKSTTLKSLFASYSNTYADVAALLTSTSSFRLDFILSDNQIDNYSYLDKFEYKNYQDTMSIFIKTVFIKFASDNSLTFDGGLYTDTYFSALRMLVYDCRWAVNPISPHLHTIDQVVLNPTKTFYDLFKLILQVFGATYSISGSTITLRKIDSISLTSYNDWSDKLIRINNKNFTVPSTAKNNYFRYSAQNDADKTLNQTNLVSNNNNIPFETDLITFGSSVYPIAELSMYSGGTSKYSIYIKDNAVKLDTGLSPILNEDGIKDRSVKDIVLLINGGAMPNGLLIYLYPGIESWEVAASTTSMHFATYFNSANEYAIIEQMLDNPVFVEVDVLLNIIDIINFDPFKLVYFKQLGGLYYVNSIKDYLLNSQDKTATLELIKI